MNNDITRLKSRITEENKNNAGSRRTFSQKLKKDTVQFINDYKLSSSKASQLLDIGNTTIEKWRRNHKKEFKQISISKPIITTVKKSKQSDVNSNQVIFNQKVMIFLLVLLLAERISLY